MKKLFLITLTFFASSKSFSQLELIKEVTAPYNNYKQIAYLSNSKTSVYYPEKWINGYPHKIKYLHLNSNIQHFEVRKI